MEESNQETETIQDTRNGAELEDKPVCCRAMTATCLACAAEISIDDYCKENPKTVGCANFQNLSTEKPYHKKNSYSKKNWIILILILILLGLAVVNA